MFRRPLVVHLLLLLLTMIWGATFVAVKVLVSEIEVAAATALRFSIAALALLALLPTLPRPAPAPGDRLRLVAIGFLSVACYHLALNSGVSYLPAGIASLVIATNPAFTAALAALFLREPLSVAKLLGILLAFAGLAVVALLGSAEQRAGSGVSLIGLGLTLLAPISWAASTIVSKPMLGRFDPLALTTYATLVGSLFLLPLAPSMVGRLALLSGWGWFAALYLGLLGTVLGYIIWYNGLRALSATGTTIYVNLIPFFGLIAAWLILDERITLFLLAGGGLIVAGVLLTNLGDSLLRSRTGGM